MSTPLPGITPTPTEIPALLPSSSPAPTAEALAVSAANVNDKEQVQHGLQVYKQLYCGLCHKLDAAGTAGTFGPPHNGMGIIATERLQEPQYTGQASTAAEYIHESIVDPKAFIVPDYRQTQHQMPVYNFLSEADVDALVQMLLQQK
jgi:mono/diheme cytochrome c family protein